MANPDHVALIKKGVGAWNAWRDENPDIIPDLSGEIFDAANISEADLRDGRFGKAELQFADFHRANLSRTYLFQANLRDANLSQANLTGANLSQANLNRANLSEANLHKAILIKTDLTEGVILNRANLREADLLKANLTGAKLRVADLIKAKLNGANLREADLIQANLIEADLHRANLSHANLFQANLRGANLREANLREADLRGANLSKANLEAASLLNADLTGADLTGCRIYGVSAWGLKLDESTKQQNLVIISENEPAITVDNIEVAQFIYLLLHNQKIRDVIDTITSKTVLILGRFTDKRKAVLDALREELRKRDYLPILFDFDVPATRDITETVSLLARMARFIIADLTDPSSIPKELEAIVPNLAVPVQPLLEGSSRPYAMFKDYWKYDWVLPVYRYEGPEPLLANLAENVITPAEGKVKLLEERRRLIGEELTKPQ